MTELNNNLSAREIEILQLVAKGLTNREIAYKLTISHNTVKVHLSNIFEKISVASRTEATLYGIEHGLIDLPGRDETADIAEVGPTLRDFLQKYVWLIIPLVLLFISLVTLTAINLFKPKSPKGLPLTVAVDRWKELSPMPVSSVGMASVAYNGEIYAIAGESQDGISGNVFRYTPETDSWVQLSEKPTPVAGVQSVLIGEKIYVPGGRKDDGEITNILDIYNPRQDAWSTGASTPQPISDYALAGFEGQLYLFGGWNGHQVLDVVYVYDPTTDAWSDATPMTTPRRSAGAVALADKIIVAGGNNYEGALKEVTSYYPARDTNGESPWEDFVDLPEARYDFGIANVSDAIHIIGGITGDGAPNEPLGRVLIDGSWNLFETNFVKELRSPSLISIGSLLYLINPAINLDKAELRSYQAYYYEIFLPVIQ